MKVALAQMVSGDDVATNLNTIQEHIKSAASLGAALVVFPENCLLMQSSQLLQLAQQIHASPDFFDEIAKSAAHFQISVVLGSVPLLTKVAGEENRVRAAALIWDAKGSLVSRYDKIHLFDANVSDEHGSYRESRFITPGDSLVTAQIGDFCFGLSICYDLRFPELFQKLRALGAQVLLVPAAFTQVTGEAHWQVLLRARAIENQCYILGVNQGGLHSPSRETYGHTLAVDPWGNIIGILDKGPSLLVVDLSLDKLNSVRAAMPVFEHRRTLK